MPGIAFFTDPVASTIVCAWISASPARTVPPEVSAPADSMTSTLFFFIRPATPPVSVLTTFSRRAMTPSQSTSGSDTLSPKSPASRISASTSAVRRTALAGMHA